MAFLQSNIPHFKCWVRREYTHNHLKYHGEFLHAMAIAVTTIPARTLSFQVIFTGAETYDSDEPNVHGGAMWARMPITALVGDTPLEEWPEPMPAWAAQPWDCASRTHAVYVLDRCQPCPWLAKIDGKFYPAKYYFTVDYTDCLTDLPPSGVEIDAEGISRALALGSEFAIVIVELAAVESKDPCLGLYLKEAFGKLPTLASDIVSEIADGTRTGTVSVATIPLASEACSAE